MAVHRFVTTSSTDALVTCDDDAVLDRDAAALMAETLDDLPHVQAVIADATVAGNRRRRPGWSPTGVLTDPVELTAVAVRASFADDIITTGDLADRLRVARRLLESGAEVAHLPRSVVRVAAPEELDADQWTELTTTIASLAPGVSLLPGVRPGSFTLDPGPHRAPITALIPTAGFAGADGAPAVEKALASVLAEMGDDDRVLLVVGAEFRGDPVMLTPDTRVGIVRRRGDVFNFSVAVNSGLLAATTDLVLLLNDDTETDQPGWLDRLAVHLTDSTVAAAAPLLRFPDGTIQHVGVILDDARPLHSFVGQEPTHLAEHHCDVARDVLAVTGACMLVRRDDALAVGGFNTDFALSFNDIDFCLKLRRAGRRIVIEPGASLVHHESLSRTPTITGAEWDTYIRRWGHVEDPWYHPDHHRPDDPEDLNRNADHLAPIIQPPPASARDTRIRSRVHHGRIQAAD